MAVDFSAFDEQVDLNALQKEVQEADDSQFEDVPDGNYDVSFDKMEIKPTKKGDKLMFSVQCSILEGNQKGRKIFFNRTISGNTSQKWTNGMAIKSVCTSTTVILLIAYLIFFRKYRVKLVQQLPIRLMTSIQSRSTKRLICKNF